VSVPLENQPKVLIIDDEEAGRFGLRRALSSQGYLLDEAEDGMTGWEKIESFRPDVIVSDINMPGMDGMTLLRRVNQREEPPLVVLITAYGSEQIAIEALRSGAYDYVAKPFEVVELRRAVSSAVERQRLLRENRYYVSELQRTLAELKESQAARGQAEKMASLGRLVAGVAHEINNPLGVLQSGVGTLELAAKKISDWCKDQPPETTVRVKELADVLAITATQSRAAAGRIHAVVTNLRQFAQLDRADVRRVDVREGLDSTLRLLEHELSRHAEVVKDYGEVPEIDCQPRELNQVFMNLLLNARDALEQTARRGQIRVKAWSEGDEVKIEISDTGGGIPPENLDRIFDPGFTTKGVRVGTGLGLPICHQIVRAHHGRIDVKSEPGAGTAFTVSLPVRWSE
jgi:signal transduction histidine kinase